MRRAVLLLLAVAAIAATVLLTTRGAPLPKISGFVEAHVIRVGSRVGGRIRAVAVREGERVERGRLLIELEPFDLAERRAEQESLLAADRAQLAELRAGSRSEVIAESRAQRDRLQAQLDALVAGPRTEEIATSRSRLELAQATLELARQEHSRAADLYERQIASAGDFDRAVAALKVREAEVEARRQELALLEAGTRAEDIAAARAEVAAAQAALDLAEAGARAEEITRAEAKVQAAEAALRAFDRQLDETRITSPLDGVVDAIDLRPGDLVAANQPLLSLLDPAAIYVRAWLPESMLVLEPGAEVEVAVDAWPERHFRARVRFVSRYAEFTPGNIQTQDERQKQVFRVEVDLLEGHDQLRPGMCADVWFAPRARP
jgi:multidrug resistance efflux pump